MKYLVVHTRQMTPVGSFPEAALDASFRGRDEQVRGCRALEAYHSWIGADERFRGAC